MKLMWSFLCLALFLSICAPLVAAQGGLKMRITKKGIDYANTVAQALIQDKLRTIRIPNFPFSGGYVSGNASNVQTTSISGPTSSLSLNPGQNGLTWSLTGFYVNLKADWRARYKRGWIKFSNHGRVSVRLTDASITVTIGFGNSNGRPALQLKYCNAYIENVRVRFHGISSIYHLFEGTVANKAKDKLTHEICEQVSKVVNEDATAGVKVTAEIDHRFLVDYGLVAPVSVTSQYLESQHKGEVTWKSDRLPSPYSPPRFPDFSDTSRMLYLWLSEYTAGTFFYAAHTYGYLQYTLTKARLPASQAGFLDTTCGGTSMCAGAFLPQLQQICPNSSVSVGIRSGAVPQTTITSQAITVSIVTNVDLDLECSMPNPTIVKVMRLNVSLSLTANLSIVNDLLKARIVDHSFTLDLVTPPFGGIGLMWGLERLIDETLQLFVIPRVNERGQVGLELPVSNDIAFKNAQLSLHEGFVVLSSDVEYRRV